MKPTDLEILHDERCICGEGPLWVPGEQALYWTDIPNGRLWRYDHATEQVSLPHEGRHLGGMTLQGDGRLLLFQDRGTVSRWRAGEPLETIIEEVPLEARSRFNDVAADPRGRVFAGAMPVDKPEGGGWERKGNLYRIDSDRGYRIVDDGFGCANGMGWSLDHTLMYFTDSHVRTIYVYDYDIETGHIENRRTFATTPDDRVPDGMTVDSEGCVWSAEWGGYGVTRYDPDGQTMLHLDLPAKQTTSVMFGGPELDELYITSAAANDDGKPGEHPGALFRVRPGARGLPEFKSAIE